jgi:serine/threonine protein phosphatase PrpC
MTNRLGNRTSNQDRIKILHAHGCVLLLLADGMGGHSGGDLAAQEMIDSIARSFYGQLLPTNYPENFLSKAVKQAHADIVKLGNLQTPPIQPRTTCVACLIQGQSACWAHVGDSRLYMIRDKQILTRTRDHTYVEDLYQHKAITEKEMLTHPMRNYVTQCLGGDPQPPPVTLSRHDDLQPGDIFLLCSDGLWGALPEREWLSVLARKPLEEALVEIAALAERMSYPHSDNISIVAICLEPDQDIDIEKEDIGPDGVVTEHIETLEDAVHEIQEALDEYGDEIEAEHQQDENKKGG